MFSPLKTLTIFWLSDSERLLVFIFVEWVRCLAHSTGLWVCHVFPP